MNGELAQLCDIAISARVALQKKEKIQYTYSNYERNIVFQFLKDAKNPATDVPQWFIRCIEKGLQEVKMLSPVTVAERSLLGFSNTSGGSLVCVFASGEVTYFCPQWQFKSDCWDVTYTEHQWSVLPSQIPHFDDTTEAFKSVLKQIAHFARKIEFPEFATIFDKAFQILEGTTKVSGYHQSYYDRLPLPNARLFCAAATADVFGAMGSWNDSPPYYAHEKGLSQQYEELSAELLSQVRKALLFAVNEF